MFRAEFTHDAMTINLEVIPGPGYESDDRGFDLLGRAIVEMIESYDMQLLEKEHGHEEVMHVYSSFLRSIAHLYTLDDPNSRELTVQEALKELTGNLVSAGMLQEKITHDRDD